MCKNLEVRTFAYGNLKFMLEWGGVGADDVSRKKLSLIKVCYSSEKSLLFALCQTRFSCMFAE